MGDVLALASRVLAAAGRGDNHAVLGVASSATAKELKTAWLCVRVPIRLNAPWRSVRCWPDAAWANPHTVKSLPCRTHARMHSDSQGRCHWGFGTAVVPR